MDEEWEREHWTWRVDMVNQKAQEQSILNCKQNPVNTSARRLLCGSRARDSRQNKICSSGSFRAIKRCSKLAVSGVSRHERNWKKLVLGSRIAYGSAGTFLIRIPWEVGIVRIPLRLAFFVSSQI